MNAGLLAMLLLASAQESDGVDFTRDIEPLFKSACHKCHAGEKVKGQLRLDSKALAMKGGVNGRVIVPGRSTESLLYKLLLEPNEEDRMPQKSPPLPKEKIDLIRRWIDQGARWPDSAEAKVEVHWAYVKPVRKEAPSTSLGASWVRNPVDAFVLARLESAGLRPSPEADRSTLVKRLYYDLTGLPPEPADVDGDYEKLVDRLLASRHFGERWGRHWLDKARYADSDGYEKDNARPDAWRWRDWVIEAVNADLPYDRFTIEQLAGDLLPGAGPLQKLATAFHRQTLSNLEGGVDKEQFRVEAVFDRAETTGAVWLGLTVGCARCHSHKYDRLSHAEYYRLFAFFNNADEVNVEVPSTEEALARHEKELARRAGEAAALEEKLKRVRHVLEQEFPAWEREMREKLGAEAADPVRHHPIEILGVESPSEVTFQKIADGSHLVGGAAAPTDRYEVTARLEPTTLSGFRLEVLPHKTLPKNGPGRAENGNFVLSEFRVEVDGRPVAIGDYGSDYSQEGWPLKGALDGDPKTGWAVGPQVGKRHEAVFYTKEPLEVGASSKLVFTLEQQHGDGHTLGRFRLMALSGRRPAVSLPADVRKILALDPGKRTAAQHGRLLDHYASLSPSTKELASQIEELKRPPKGPVLNARVMAQRVAEPRETRIFRRGEFLQPTDPVQPGVPGTLPPLKARGAVPDRLDLAQWLFDPDHPLTGRVAVNHVWSALFGRGLVRTPGDFGMRGERPTHPELLDWLATEFPRLGWSRKALIRLIVTSSAYRQASRHLPELAERDPLNDLFHRQNRFRVESEIVRDLTLSAAGLLSRKIGGPSVFPPMAADVAFQSYANNFKYKPSTGEDRHRRGLYTFIKRTAPHPHLTTFDGPDNTTACVERRVSNTPLQALTALNNEVFVEAAQAFARRILAGPPGDAERIEAAFLACTARRPSAAERGRLLRLLAAARAHYPGGDGEPAAWTATLRVILNLDEFLTRE